MRRWYLVFPAALLLTLAPTSARYDAQAATPPKAAATRIERHPRIRSAIRELEAAKAELQKAPHDFGGHRADAVIAVDRAVAQLRLALQYDK